MGLREGHVGDTLDIGQEGADREYHPVVVEDHIDHVGQHAAYPVTGGLFSLDDTMSGPTHIISHFLLFLVAQLPSEKMVDLIDRQSAHPRERPGHDFRIAVLSHDIGMNMTAVDNKELSQQSPEAGCGEDRTRPDHPEAANRLATCVITSTGLVVITSTAPGACLRMAGIISLSMVALSTARSSRDWPGCLLLPAATMTTELPVRSG